MELFDLRGRKVLVTGATRGIGRAIAWRIAEHGGELIVSSRRQAACDALVVELNDRFGGGQSIATSVAADIRDPAAVDALGRAAVTAGANALVWNAALSGHYGPSAEIDEATFTNHLRANVYGAMALSNVLAPGLRDQGGGSIILISSVGALIGSPMLGAYTLAKASLHQLARNLAVEFGSSNIRVNCIAPGTIETDMTAGLLAVPDVATRLTTWPLLKRIGRPDEVAGAAVYLLAPAGAYVTGQVLITDGGATVGQV